MRCVTVLSSLLLLVGCAEKPVAAAAKDGTLVLELGGGDSLAATLRNAGVELLPQQPTRQPVVPRTGNEPGSNDNPAPPTKGGGTTEPPKTGPETPGPEVVESPASIEIVVKKGQTVMAIAQEHLGTTKRYREILTLNGMDEERAKRIKPGDKLKVPKAAAAAPHK